MGTASAGTPNLIPDASSNVRIAVDIGGTFTDIAVAMPDGLIHESKVSSTPDDPARAVVDGVAQLLSELGISPSAVAEILHGTTVGSNTILQRKVAETGLITTRGFRDVLEIGVAAGHGVLHDAARDLARKRHQS